MAKKRYEKPEIADEREIEALVGGCLPMGQDTLQDKLQSDPNTGVCVNVVT